MLLVPAFPKSLLVVRRATFDKRRHKSSWVTCSNCWLPAEPTTGSQLSLSWRKSSKNQERITTLSHSSLTHSLPVIQPVPPLTESRLPWDKHHVMTLLHTLSLPYLLFRSSRQTKTPLFSTPLPLPSLNPVFSYKRSHSVLIARDYFFFFLFLSLPFPPSSLLSSLCGGGVLFQVFFLPPPKRRAPQTPNPNQNENSRGTWLGLAWPGLAWRGVGAFLYFPYTPAGLSWHGFIGLWSKCTWNSVNYDSGEACE